jgi:uncharacterized linocin/CFP29 family protein
VNDLRRDLAPIPDAAWRAIDEEATRTLKLKLAARKLVDFSGPLGLEAGAVSTGRRHAIGAPPVKGVTALTREVLPLIELEVDFELDRAELDAVARGADDPDLEPVKQAASRLAQAEDAAVFHGYDPGGIQGITERTPHKPVAIPAAYEDYPKAVAQAVRMLHIAGVDGPYALALGPRCYEGLTQATEGGYPVLKVVKLMIDGPVVWAPAVNGAVVLSTRGDDFELTVGRDIAIGYRDHTAEKVRLYFTESFTFRTLTPEAAVALVYG